MTVFILTFLIVCSIIVAYESFQKSRLLLGIGLSICASLLWLALDIIKGCPM